MDNLTIGPTPPPWTLPGTTPNWDAQTHHGTTILTWTRDLGAVWIACDDTIDNQELVRGPAVIRMNEPVGDLDPAGARQLAAQLIAAAALLDGNSAGWSEIPADSGG
jgi:hypothetical protein